MRQYLLPVLVICVCIALEAVRGARPNRKRGGNGRPNVQRNKLKCKYDRLTSAPSECTSIDQLVRVNLQLNTTATKKEKCPQTKEVQFNCSKGCRYENPVLACVKETRTVTRTLMADLPSYCPKSKTVTKQKRCNERSTRGANKCRYRPQADTRWSACDANNQTSRTINLVEKKRPAPAECQPTKVETKPCVCRYKRGDWSPCDAVTNAKTRTDSLNLRASPSSCDATRTKTKQCRRKAARNNNGENGRGAGGERGRGRGRRPGGRGGKQQNRGTQKRN